MLFHMIGAVSQFGKLGLTVIGNGHEQVDAIYEKTIAVLDHETRFGRVPKRLARQLSAIEDPKKLDELFRCAATCATLAAFGTALENS